MADTSDAGIGATQRAESTPGTGTIQNKQLVNVGAVLDGIYTLDELVGAGGMGRVYRATCDRVKWIAKYRNLKPEDLAGMPESAYISHIDPRIKDGVCAVKVLDEDSQKTPTSATRFEREADLLAQFDNPYLVKGFGRGRTPEGAAYYAMEFIRNGKSLRGLQRPVPVDRVLQILEGAAAGLAYLHANGVIHRDLKPSNIMVNSDDPKILKIIDLGIAKDTLQAELTMDGRGIPATPAYAPPERLSPSTWNAPPENERNIPGHLDVYSLSLIAVALLDRDIYTPSEDDKGYVKLFKEISDERLRHPYNWDDLAKRAPYELVGLLMQGADKAWWLRPSMHEFCERVQNIRANLGAPARLSDTTVLKLKVLEGNVARLELRDCTDEETCSMEIERLVEEAEQSVKERQFSRAYLRCRETEKMFPNLKRNKERYDTLRKRIGEIGTALEQYVMSIEKFRDIVASLDKVNDDYWELKESARSMNVPYADLSSKALRVADRAKDVRERLEKIDPNIGREYHVALRWIKLLETTSPALPRRLKRWSKSAVTRAIAELDRGEDTKDTKITKPHIDSIERAISVLSPEDKTEILACAGKYKVLLSVS